METILKLSQFERMSECHKNEIIMCWLSIGVFIWTRAHFEYNDMHVCARCKDRSHAQNGTSFCVGAPMCLRWFLFLFPFFSCVLMHTASCSITILQSCECDTRRRDIPVPITPSRSLPRSLHSSFLLPTSEPQIQTELSQIYVRAFPISK